MKKEAPKPKYCKDCKSYKRPKCTKHNGYVARKNKCDDFSRKKSK